MFLLRGHFAIPRKPRFLLLTLASILSILLIAVPASFCAPESGDDVVITILHTNDMHGHVLFPGKPQGLSKIATLVRRVRAEMPNVLMLDAGDMTHGTPEEKEFKGTPLLAAMNAVPYDAAASGNHEFDFGQPVTRGTIRNAAFPILSANVLDTTTGQPWGGFKPYIIREIHGIRVAIFGLTTEMTETIEWPTTLAGIRFADPIETAKTLVPKLRGEEHADVVIALTHLGVPKPLTGTSRFSNDIELAKAVPGIDFIVGGHSHTRLSKQVWIGDTLIGQTGSTALMLGRMDFVVHKGADGKARIVSVNGKEGRWWGQDGVPAPLGKTYPKDPLIPLTADIPDDPAVVAAYKPYEDKVEARLDEVLTRLPEPLSPEGSNQRETPLGDILADAIRAEAKSDIALASPTQAEGTLPAGDVRVRDMYRIMGAYTRQHIVTARAPGSLIRSLLKRSITPGVTHLLISGLRVAADGGIAVDGGPLEDDKTYTVAAAAYIMQNSFLGKTGVTILNDDVQAPTVRDAAIDYLRGRAFANLSIDGRLYIPPASSAKPSAGGEDRDP